PPPVPLTCPACPAAKSPASAKQYGHFVMQDVKVNAMGVTTTIKKIRFMYKGDGIEADVAKCALTNGDSEHKGDLEKLINEVNKLVDVKKDEKKEKTECPKTETSCPSPVSGCTAPAPATCLPVPCESAPIGWVPVRPTCAPAAPCSKPCLPTIKCE